MLKLSHEIDAFTVQFSRHRTRDHNAVSACSSVPGEGSESVMHLSFHVCMGVTVVRNFRQTLLLLRGTLFAVISRRVMSP